MKKFLIFTLCLFMLTGCAAVPTDPADLKIYEQNNDPLEPLNRTVSSFNFTLNKYVLRPFSKIYRFVVPTFLRDGIANISENLSQPVIAINGLLQGDFDASAQTIGRFFTNSTLGLFGFFDVATPLGIENPKKDFGQTLYTWGLKDSGPYLVLPLLGPSNVRDTAGMGINFFIDPIDWALPQSEKKLLLTRYIVQGIVSADNATDLLWNVQQSSVDPYSALRTMAQQNRNMFLKGENAVTTDYDFAFEEDEEESF